MSRFEPVIGIPQEELEDRLRRLVAAFAELDDAVIVMDDVGAVVLRNAAAMRFVDARHGDALAAATIDQLLHDARQGRTGEQELTLHGPPAQVLHIRAVPLVDDGGELGAAAFVRDLSETRRLERMRRDFVANVSHELRTPIGAVGVLTETLAASGDPAVVEEFATRVVVEVDRLARVIDDLLALSELEATDAGSDGECRLDEVLPEAVHFLGPSARAAGIDVRIGTPVPSTVVVGEHRHVLSAVTNLIDNAIKYSEAGSSVTLEVDLDGEDAVVTVRDRGIGIPARDLERIFERFYRVDRARSRATGGTGLGLSIVRNVAQTSGGRVEVESTEGVGSTFRLSLPIVPGPDVAPTDSRGLE